jgi:hypothetical protein
VHCAGRIELIGPKSGTGPLAGLTHRDKLLETVLDMLPVVHLGVLTSPAHIETK